MAKKKELTPEEILEKEQQDLEDLKSLQYNNHAAFDEEGNLIGIENIIVTPRDEDLLAYCPFLTEIKIAQKFMPYFNAYFKYKPTPIANVNWSEANFVHIC